jgi:hypothetical protein
MELNAGVELDATECAEVIGAELVSGMDVGSGRGRQMEHGRDRRRESRRRASGASAGGGGSAGIVYPASGGGTDEKSPSYERRRVA